MDSVTLVCPPGASDAPISHGATNYRPYLADPRDPQSHWHVTVPPEAAHHLLHKGGFALPQVHIFQSAGSVRMIALHGTPSCSWGGQTFLPDEDGAVTVPVEAMADLSNHYFVPYNEALAPKHEEPPTAPAVAPAKPPRQTAEGGGATKLPEDPKGSPHPDEAPAPPKKPAPAPEPAAASAKSS